jgi:hypothetical protein
MPDATNTRPSDTPERTEHYQTEGVPVALRYTYEQPHKDPVDLEAFWTSRREFHLLVDGSMATRVEEIEREMSAILSGGETRIVTQYKPECVDRHYYPTLQQACEGAVKTLRRQGDLD